MADEIADFMRHQYANPPLLAMQKQFSAATARIC